MRKVISVVAIAAGFTLAMSQNANATTVQSKAYSVAKAQLGDPYVYGAVGPNSFDCSGLTQYSYKKAGKYIPHYTGSQFKYTNDITVNQRVPGDLIFWSHKGTHDRFHVSMYAGNGYMIHANAGSYLGYKVVKEKVGSYWSKHYNGDYRRVK
ncbi:lipoprotein [Streptomyces phage BillNye]|uniref:Lipoprotein n=1 Tax=Streptomyces phage BillNye TaxID=2079426 RepID=A0A2L1IW19_9CAUD|nr:lipoprotein [Streptomyces phage BillNye]AVD99377.1 lipoprotein [Streptomyces phage BillNye]